MAHSSPADYLTTATLVALRDLCPPLADQFDAPFHVWKRHEDSVQRVHPATEPQGASPRSSSPTDASVDDREIARALFAAWPDRNEGIRCEPFSPGHFLVIVPPREMLTPTLDYVVAGVIACDSAQWIEPLVDNLLRRVECEQRLRENETQFDEYAYQVTTDFEELTWLRSLAEHIELCDIQNDLAMVAGHVLPDLNDLIHAEAIALMVRDPQDDNSDPTERRAVCGFVTGEPPIDAQTRERLVREVWSQAVDQPLVRNAPRRDVVTDETYGMRNFILVQIARGKRQYGWLLVMNRHVRSHTRTSEGINASCLSEWEFGTFEAGLLNAAAIMLATHARNSELFGEKEQLIIGMIRAMMNAIDAKDPYTCGHSDRVAMIAKRLAEEIGLSHGECERIYMAGLLHDVGKIGVPDQVLCKPGPLTEEEFAKIKLHPEIGYSILKHVRQLQYVLPGVLYHHEKVNGQGYPAGLAGDAIPLQGRILAVADAFDAMTSSRSYRKAMPLSKAESIFRDGAGSQWDAAIVDALLAAMPDIQGICESDAERRESALAERGPQQGVVEGLDFITAAVSAMESV